ncbi:Fungalysin metallopeptidase-domain-containing protein [Mycena rebaudengoi]|nr:Fungalysin metallopeptidase-domain-containing protein [Mycena rebaudengoi]
MPAFNKFFATVLFAVVCASSVLAAPSLGPESRSASAKHPTHRKRTLPSGLELESYHPLSTFETFGPGIDHPLRKRAGASLRASSLAFIQDKLNVKTGDIAFTSGYTGATASYTYTAQTHKGIPFANAVANVAFNQDDKVVAFGSSFVTPKTIADSSPSISFEDARATAEKQLAGSHKGMPPSKLKYLAKEDGSAALVYSFQVNNQESGTWYEAFVDAHSGELLSVVDFLSESSYLVLSITKKTLLEGFEERVNPHDPIASPKGWHGEDSATTSGNNLFSFYDTSTLSGQASQTADGRVFDYVQDPTLAPNATVNIGAGIVNNFYIANTMHDIAYRYGFTEAASTSNKTTLASAAWETTRFVVMSSLRLGSTMPASGLPPSIGQQGSMFLFLWNYTTPFRDGSLENDVAVHEYTHGITNRMTGGGTAGCLQTLESGSLGEGWAAEYAAGGPSTRAPPSLTTQSRRTSSTGLRKYPYSMSKTTNPLTYASIGTLDEVHDAGEVWANLLHNVYAALVGQHGFSDTAFTDPDQPEGNVVYLHLFIDALPLQPCNPTITQTRDAWIQADINRYTARTNASSGPPSPAAVSVLTPPASSTTLTLCYLPTYLPEDC